MSIDNIISGAILISLLFGFLSIVVWAYSKKRQEDFEFMSRLPLDDDDIQKGKIEERFKNVD